MDTQVNLFPNDDILKAARPRLIAFAGRAGSGKSTAANTLIRLGWHRVKFADPLKNMLRSLYRSVGVSITETERRIEGDLKEEPDPVLQGNTPRWAMQALGQEWGRECLCDNFWTSLWEQAVLSAWNRGLNVVTDDLRYENEVEVVRELGGSTVMVSRPASMVVKPGHLSENFGFKTDRVLVNDGRKEELIEAVRELAWS